MPLRYPHLTGLQWYAFIPVTYDVDMNVESADDDDDDVIETNQGTDKGKGYSQKDKGYSHQAFSDNPEVIRCIGQQGTLGDSFSHGAHRLAMLQRQVQKTIHPSIYLTVAS